MKNDKWSEGRALPLEGPGSDPASATSRPGSAQNGQICLNLRGMGFSRRYEARSLFKQRLFHQNALCALRVFAVNSGSVMGSDPWVPRFASNRTQAGPACHRV